MADTTKPDLDVVARAALDFSHLYGPHGGDVTPPAEPPTKPAAQESMQLDPLAKTVLDFSHLYGAHGGAWQLIKHTAEKVASALQSQKAEAAEPDAHLPKAGAGR